MNKLFVPKGNGVKHWCMVCEKYTLHFEELMNAAVEVWPDNAWIQEYLSRDD